MDPYKKFSGRTLPLLFIALVVLITIMVAFTLFAYANQSTIISYLQGQNQEDLKQNLRTGGAILMSLVVIIFVGAFASLFLDLFRKNKALSTRGITAFCKIQKVENVTYKDEHGHVIEYKNVSLATPLQKECIFQLPITEDVKTGDSLMIVYDSSNPDYFNIAYPNGQRVIKKANRIE